MARKLAFFGLVLLIGLALAGAADSDAMALDDGADSSIGNEGSGAAVGAPDGTAEAEEAPIGGPVPLGAFSGAVGVPGPAAEQNAASTFQRSTLLGASGLGAIVFFF